MWWSNAWGHASVLQALTVLEYELLLFASFWMILGALDEFAIDLCWLWLRVRGLAQDRCLREDEEIQPLEGRAAVLVPAWREAQVIGAMIRHTLDAWPQAGWTLYVGCYRNDPETLAAARLGAEQDPRVCRANNYRGCGAGILRDAAWIFRDEKCLKSAGFALA